jgi:hypothetical protein
MSVFVVAVLACVIVLTDLSTHVVQKGAFTLELLMLLLQHLPLLSACCVILMLALHDGWIAEGTCPRAL